MKHLTVTPDIYDKQEGTIVRSRVPRQRMQSKTERNLEFRYAVSLLAIFTLSVTANCLDYVKYSTLIAAYDLSVPFGLPFVMVVKGGAIVVRPEIVWNGVAANVFLVLWSSAVVAWLWHKIAAR
jgi:hypothetical protein